MTMESLQRAAEAAGFATASDDNQDAPVRAARRAEISPLSYPASLLAGPRAPLVADAVTAAAHPTLWGRTNLGQYIPAWAVKG
jgi:hypothetical protein